MKQPVVYIFSESVRIEVDGKELCEYTCEYGSRVIRLDVNKPRPTKIFCVESPEGMRFSLDHEYVWYTENGELIDTTLEDVSSLEAAVEKFREAKEYYVLSYEECIGALERAIQRAKEAANEVKH